MSHSSSGVGLVAAARSVAEVVAANADQAERDRRLPAATVDALVGAGLMRMCVPSAYGGPDASPMEVVEAIEAVAAVDGAAGWCVMIASTTSSMSLFLPPQWAQEIYGDPAVVTGGVYAPNGTGEVVEGGWRVSGRWAWGSGTQHCQWITGGTRTPDGAFHLMFFDAADVTFHDTWHTVGMRGTGSLDFSVDGAWVPEGRTVLPGVGKPTIECALAAFPNYSLLASGVAAVGLGVARHALDEVTELAQGKRPLFASRPLAQSGSVQAELARAEARWRAARAFLLGELAEAWDTASAGGRVDVPLRARIRLACVHAAEAAAAVTDTAYTLAGGTSVYESSPLQRCLRDAHVATQHLMVSFRIYETLGKLQLGLDADTSAL
jgi:alkylation response protein AidB-like acyl-CoA dehydrogenase